MITAQAHDRYLAEAQLARARTRWLRRYLMLVDSRRLRICEETELHEYIENEQYPARLA